VRGPTRGESLRGGAKQGLGEHNDGSDVRGRAVQMCEVGNRCRSNARIKMSGGGVR
jgi:hypothetical protein